MRPKISFIPYTLNFKFDAGTSRGVLKNKISYFIIIEYNGIRGIGEAGPLPQLSIENNEKINTQLPILIEKISQIELPTNIKGVFDFVNHNIPVDLPSIRFAFETALLDLINGGHKIIFKNSFSNGDSSLTINGLVWMGEEKFMLEQINKKLEDGYSCIKIKIGAIDFKRECSILKSIRDRFSSKEITIRVDANGAFGKEDAVEKLKTLAEFEIHSIEQPIKQGQINLMNQLCLNSPIPIALDEELIGVIGYENKLKLLEVIQPDYIILKPTLIGGIYETKEWISIAESLNIGWWITSALESNIGLNAVAQLTAEYNVSIPQGLGTGGLYYNNFSSPLSLEREELFYRKEGTQWETTLLDANF